MGGLRCGECKRAQNDLRKNTHSHRCQDIITATKRHHLNTLASSAPLRKGSLASMATKAESRALAFFAGLFALGGLLRVAATLRPAGPAEVAADSAALAAQLARVDTARAQPERGTRRGRAARTPRSALDTMPPSAPAGLPPELAAVTGWFSRPGADPAPPRPILARTRERSTTRSAPPAAPTTPEGLPSLPLDLDQASEAAIEALPGIGPSLARRLVADRAAHGPFGSLDALARVKGVGPVLQARLAPHVTFSGVARPE